MLKRRFTRSLVAAVVLVAMLCQGTLVLAGTTGGVSGTVLDENNAPVTNALVSVASPSASNHTTTDGAGKFVFLALIPDTYTLSVEKRVYEPVAQTGLTVIADQNQNVSLATRHALQTIGRISSRASSSLIKPGTTVDVYSIDATQQDKLAGVGGGGNLNTAWSAIATVPGVFVSPGQAGYIGAGGTVSIRGGDYNQIGYEIDGVPVNRAFDNYPSGPASSLGQQELQVYTGVPPANAQANGLSGFINQVIRTGTYPGFANADFGVGGPSYYHKFSFEAGGSNPSRNFSYYVGLGGYNQEIRQLDNFNGAGVSNLWGLVQGGCAGQPISVAPSCYGGFTNQTQTNPQGTYTPGLYNGNTPQGSFVLGPYSVLGETIGHLADRDTVLNFHFGIPHKNGTKDDIQLLAMVNYIQNNFDSSTNDNGGAAYLNAIGYGTPHFFDGYLYNGKTGVPLPANFQSLMSPYFFPNVPQHAFNGTIPPNERDGFLNNQAIYKLQYTHNMGSNALLKVYGYSYYSDWLNTGPNAAYAGSAVGVADDFTPGDYELSSHTRGVSGTFIDQINSSNLINFTGSYTTSSTTRDNNSTYLDTSGTVGVRTAMAVLVDSSNPTNGLCYTAARVATTCYPANGFAQFVTFKSAFNGTAAPVPVGNCGVGACEYFVVGDGNYATYNQVQPIFYQSSLTDEFRPNSKLTINAGIRFDDFQYVGANTQGTAARTLWYNALNMDTCIKTDGSGTIADKVRNLGLASPSAACPAGYTAFSASNPVGATNTYPEWEPRIGATYSLDPFTVLRASYGRYAQGPNTAFEQYDGLQPVFPYTSFYTYAFQKFGFTTPLHPITPEVSNNYDFSIEHQFRGDTSMKITPFWRTTQGQIEQFFLNQATFFVSGANVGKQTSQGIEFELDKGNFAAQGLSARLSFTYTNTYIKYTPLPNGTSVITPFNIDVANYNAYTKACAAGGSLAGKTQYGQSICGSTVGGAAAAPCYTPAGTADNACAGASIANPYWNATAQGLVDPNGSYPAFDLIPVGIGSSYNAYGAPYIASLVLNWRRGKFAIAPIVQMFAGQRYGAPETTLGVAPDTCAALGALSPSDPRYSGGTAGQTTGSAFDAGTCGSQLAAIPDRYTGRFDGIGGFAQPAQLQLHLQATYDLSSRMTLVVNATNIVNSCFGGTAVKWAVANACSYGVDGLGNGYTGDVGNVYNPGQAIQPYVNQPYTPTFATSPFTLFVNLKVKI